MEKGEIHENANEKMAGNKRGQRKTRYEIRPRKKTNQLVHEYKSLEDSAQTKNLDLSAVSTPRAKKAAKSPVKGPRKGQKYTSQYRSNISAMIKLISTIKLTKEHVTQLRKTPFWFLFKAFLSRKVDLSSCRKFDDDVVEIIQTYNTKSKAFRLGSKIVHLSDSDISLIFGISSGATHMNLSYANKPNTEFVRRRCLKTKRLTAPVIKELLQTALRGKRKEDIEDVARLLCLYLCLTLFFATSGQTIGWVYLNYIEELDSMKTYAWSEAIRRNLMSSIEKSYQFPEKVTGCVIVLLYWLCEHTKIVDAERKNEFPRFLKWNFGKLNKILKERPLQRLATEEVLGAELRRTYAEQQFFSATKGIGKEEGEKEEVREEEGEEVQEEEEENEEEEEISYSDNDENEEYQVMQTKSDEEERDNDILGSLNKLCEVIAAQVDEQIKLTKESREEDPDKMMESPIKSWKHTGEISKLISEKDNVLRINHALIEERDRANIRIAQLEKENIELKHENHNKDRIVHDLQNQLEQSLTKAAELRRTVETKDAAIKRLNAVIEELEAQKSNLEEQRQELTVHTVTQIVEANKYKGAGGDASHIQETAKKTLQTKKRKLQSSMVKNMKQNDRKRRNYLKP